jgi:hypothetical protein
MVILLLVMFLNENASRCISIRGVDQPFEGGLIMAVYRISEPVRTSFGSRTRLVANYRCDCGKVFSMRCESEKKTKSCGCLRAELLKGNSYSSIHNSNGSREYKTWQSMKDRCFRKKNTKYAYYGGRGVSVCERWLCFENFLADMGERPDGCSIDRIDSNGNYEPSNCRWATMTEQARNRRSNRILTINKVAKPVFEWAKCEGAAKPATIRDRLRHGWSDAEAVFGRALCKD